MTESAKKGSTNGAVAEGSTEHLALSDPNVVLVYGDLRELSTGQIEEIEDLIDDAISSVFDTTLPQGKRHRAVAYVVRKETEPDLTFEGAKKLKLWMRSADKPVPPTKERASTSKSRSPRTSA